MIAVWLVLLSLVVPGAGLTGKIRTQDDKPVGGAVVVVRQGDRMLTATTNDGGDFDMPDVTLPATIEVHAPGFATVRQQVTASPAQITLMPSPIRESILVEGLSFAADWRWRSAETGTTVLKAQDLAAIPAVTLDESLRVVSGFSLFRRSVSRASNPTTHGVTMRGLSASGSSRGLVLMDGVPLTDGFGSWVTWTRLPALAIEAVEIDRGAQGSTFGSDALGGVLTLSSGSPRKPEATVRATGGELGIAAIDASGGGPSGDASMFGALSWFRTDGIVPTAPESAGIVDVRADAEWLNAFGKARFGSSADRMTLSGWGGWDDRGNGTPLQRNRMAGGTMAMTYDRLLAGTTLGAKISLSPNSFRQSFSSIAANRQTETLTSTQFMSTTASRLVAEMGHLLPLRGFVSARFASSLTGASFSERRSTSSVTMSLRDNSEAASVHAAWYLTDAVSLGVGLRREWREAPLRTSGADAATVGNVSGSWRLAPRVTLRGAVASSHRWPTLNELVRNFQAGAVLTRANPNLLPERAVSGEVAATISHKWWQASVGGFWTVVKDAIANVTIQSTPTIIRERRNAGEAHAQGLEVDLDAMPVSWLTLRGSFLVVDSRFRHSLEAPLEGKWLPQVPHVSGSISGDIRILERAHASFAWRTISTQFDDDRNTFLLDDAKQLDLRLRFVYRGIGGDLTVENATDARIEVGRTPLVTIAPGRTVRVSVSWRFTRQ